MTDLPLVHPNRPKSRIRPMKAMRHFRTLIQDKEDTEQVFHIIEALRGQSFIRNAKRFQKSADAQMIMKRNTYLPALLDDHEKLLELPANSLGQAYVRFMRKEGLTAAGLVEESDKMAEYHERYDDLTLWFSLRMRDTHDLYHVLTGYGRDALGEQALLGFTYSQNPNLGILFIAYAGGLHMKQNLDAKAPVFAAIKEGQRNGKAAKQIAFQDIEALLPLPIEEVRKRLNIAEPKLYRQAHAQLEAQGIDPYDLLGQAEAA